jgi:hypothetical protein
VLHCCGLIVSIHDFGDSSCVHTVYCFFQKMFTEIVPLTLSDDVSCCDMRDCSVYVIHMQCRRDLMFVT